MLELPPLSFAEVEREMALGRVTAREFTEVSETGHAHHGSQRRDDDPFMHRAARVVEVEPELHA